jgi:hypothetical protein
VTVFRVSEKRPPGQFFASFSEKRNLFGKTCVFVIVSVVAVAHRVIMGLADKDTNFVGLKLVKSNPHNPG